MQLAFSGLERTKNRKRVRQPVGKARGGKHCCLRTHRSATGTGTSALPPPRRRPRPSTPLSLPASYSFVVGFCVRSTLVPKSIPSTTPSVSLFLPFYLSCVRTQALPICLTGALLNFIIPKTSGTNCKRRRRNRRKRGQPTTEGDDHGDSRGETTRRRMVHGTREAEAEAGRLSLPPGGPSVELRRTREDRERELENVLCCVVGLPKLVFILIIILPLRLPSPARPQGTSRNEALPPFFWQTPSPRSLAPLPCLPSPAIFFQNISRSKFPGRDTRGRPGRRQGARRKSAEIAQGVQWRG